MKRRRGLPAGAADDRGAALVMVLIVVTVIGLTGAAMLTFSDTSIRTTVALRDQGATAYAADGAAQAAVDSLSTGKGFAPEVFRNATGTTCFGTSGTLNLRDFYPGTGGINGPAPSSASVVCTADPETGVNGTVVSITSANRPGQAIMTLGKTSEVGINVESPSTSPFAVKGPVRSNSSIRVQSGTLQSTAEVTAVGTCTPTGSISNPKSCSLPANAVSDPGYVPEATEVPAYQPVLSDDLANCPNGVFEFSPGYYDDAMALTALMDEDSTGACAGSTWWFKPGTYYFDFHNNENDPDYYRGAATDTGRLANQWAITSGDLVAGRPTDGDGNVVASPGASPAIPGSCQNPIKSTTAAGVQFIFGGDSQLALGGSANAEICGSYHADRPPIALYGVRSGTAKTITRDNTGDGDGPGLKMIPPVTSTDNSFINPTKVIEQDNSSARWKKSGSSTQTKTITGSGYEPSSAIPAGSIVKSAKVRVRHGNSDKYDDGDGEDELTVTFTPKGVTGSQPGPDFTLTPTLHDSKKLNTDSLAIDEPGTSDFVKYVHENGFTGADMAYTARLTHEGDEDLDAMQIDIEYVMPSFRAENITTISSNCMRATYTRTSTSRCAVLSTSVSALGSFTGDFYLQGTIYAPLAAVDLTLDNATQPVLRFGVISRSLWVKENASFSYPDPVVEIPDDTAGDNGKPIVFLTVYVCPGASTESCSADPGAVTALRVKARINDATTPSSMSILSWSNLR